MYVTHSVKHKGSVAVRCLADSPAMTRSAVAKIKRSKELAPLIKSSISKLVLHCVVSAGYNICTCPYELLCEVGRNTGDKGSVLAIYHTKIDFVFFSEFPELVTKVKHTTRAGHVANYKNFHILIFLFGSVPRCQFVFFKGLSRFVKPLFF